MYVLIVLVLSGLATDTINMQEFNSLANCEAAAAVIKQKREIAQTYAPSKSAYTPFTVCLPK